MLLLEDRMNFAAGQIVQFKRDRGGQSQLQQIKENIQLVIYPIAVGRWVSLLYCVLSPF